MKVDEVKAEVIYKALEDAGIPYEVVRSEQGWLEIGFCITDEFDRCEFEDWEVQYLCDDQYVIYHKDYNQEWQNEDGDNLVFDTKEEAEEYLRKEFGKNV